MALQFDLVSPERRLASLQATEVQIPGADGDMTAMEGHAPTITTLRPGILKVVAVAGTTSYVVTGGFAEITSAGVSVLAERAVPVAEVNAGLFDGLMADARESVAAGMDKDTGDKLLADMAALRVAAGQ
jgi:F-type H+-transporting ATPase subunit epsilon